MARKRPFGDGEDLTFERLVRGWVRDEVQRTCQSFFSTLPRSPVNANEPCKKTSLQLRFQAKLPNTFFTGSRIQSDDNTAMKLVLFDVNSNKVVSSGQFSSLKVEIVPLDGDFNVDDDEDWPEKDFDEKVIYARDGRKPLITGDLVVTLKDGVADLGELCFTDNSSWSRSRKFMIGARVKDTSNGVRIREARSIAFKVKDQRGESYKKHHPPFLSDEIWRLEKIAKDGVYHIKLASHGICTVKDFLQMYVTNQSLLRKLLGGSSNKIWEAVIKHAKDCVLDDNLYIYKCGNDGMELCLDSVLTIVGVTFDGQNYMPLDQVSLFQMPVVDALKKEAYKNLDKMVPIDDPLIRASSCLQAVNIPLVNEDEPEALSYGVVDCSNEVEVGAEQDLFSMDYFSTLLNECSNETYGQDLSADVDFQTGTSLWQGTELLNDPSNDTIDIVSSEIGIGFSSNGSPRGRWCKIRAALKWGSERRDVAARKSALWQSFLGFSV